MISIKEYNQLQIILSGSTQLGVPKHNGKETTLLVPQFLICSDCNTTMTSYLNKSRSIYYYKCNCCNKTVNVNTSKRSWSMGMHDHFNQVLDSFSFSEELKDLFARQLNKIISDEMSNLSENKKVLSTDINGLKVNYDTMEYRYAINEISKEIFDRQSQKIKEAIIQKTKELELMPSKKSNIEKAVNYFMEIAVNPSKFYDSLDYKQKRKISDPIVS